MKTLYLIAIFSVILGGCANVGNSERTVQHGATTQDVMEAIAEHHRNMVKDDNDAEYRHLERLHMVRNKLLTANNKNEIIDGFNDSIKSYQEYRSECLNSIERDKEYIQRIQEMFRNFYRQELSAPYTMGMTSEQANREWAYRNMQESQRKQDTLMFQNEAIQYGNQRINNNQNRIRNIDAHLSNLQQARQQVLSMTVQQIKEFIPGLRETFRDKS